MSYNNFSEDQSRAIRHIGKAILNIGKDDVIAADLLREAIIRLSRESLINNAEYQSVVSKTLITTTLEVLTNADHETPIQKRFETFSKLIDALSEYGEARTNQTDEQNSHDDKILNNLAEQNLHPVDEIVKARIAKGDIVRKSDGKVIASLKQPKEIMVPWELSDDPITNDDQLSPPIEEVMMKAAADRIDLTLVGCIHTDDKTFCDTCFAKISQYRQGKLDMDYDEIRRKSDNEAIATVMAGKIKESHTPKTGRFRSSDVNRQSIPRPDKNLDDVFLAGDVSTHKGSLEHVKALEQVKSTMRQNLENVFLMGCIHTDDEVVCDDCEELEEDIDELAVTQEDIDDVVNNMNDGTMIEVNQPNIDEVVNDMKYGTVPVEGYIVVGNKVTKPNGNKVVTPAMVKVAADRRPKKKVKKG